ncbi:hypothetical protein AMAG_13855 [Allomyces macrogynus ATCC 38327]|uniref:Cyclic nucleotide-binding domain-containing protein n=1 Tax=Allomyces macrogynus (strain ATCC 38327) TaxID=578462 RepID=A0A0L0T333_ALLM3|nr:hypothetical protein AMAG_13855 [Allomyces macrogynus ATCC 38327]|eukprot:KNE68979.1 hypothetical protein AMAG_13855 [Allomyces macrogynus ATCC 38327]
MGYIARYIPVDPASLSWTARLWKWVVIRSSPLYITWQHLVLVTIYLIGLLEPYKVAFDRESMYLHWLGVALDVLHGTDCLVRWHVPYVEDRIEIMDVPSIMRQWWASRTGWWDVAGFLPLELLTDPLTDLILSETQVLPQYWSRDAVRPTLFVVLRLNRMLRLHLIFTYFAERSAMLHARFSLHIVKFAFLISTMVHWYACMLYLVGCPDGCPLGSDIDGRWPGQLIPREDLRTMPTVSRYVVSVYFSCFTLTTTGYGRVNPYNTTERIIAVFGATVCNFVFGYCTGTVTSLLSNSRGVQLRYEQKLDAVREEMMQRGFPEDLQSRVLDYYSVLWMRNRGIDALSLLTTLPPAFYADVSMHMNAELLQKVPIFQGAGLSFFMALSRALRPELYLPGDLIVHRGDAGKEMYFIRRGKVEVLSEDLTEVCDAMGEGTFFGEVSLSTQNGPAHRQNPRRDALGHSGASKKPNCCAFSRTSPTGAGRIPAKAEERLDKLARRVSAKAGAGPATPFAVLRAVAAAGGSRRRESDSEKVRNGAELMPAPTRSPRSRASSEQDGSSGGQGPA